jgi:hypothetical protein
MRGTSLLTLAFLALLCFALLSAIVGIECHPLLRAGPNNNNNNNNNNNIKF